LTQPYKNIDFFAILSFFAGHSMLCTPNIPQ
jgi:hypothetical protein